MDKIDTRKTDQSMSIPNKKGPIGPMPIILEQRVRRHSRENGNLGGFRSPLS